MQTADRKLAWSLTFVLAVIAVELAWLLFVGPANHGHSAATGAAANAAGDQDYAWWQYSGAWIAIFTIVLTLSTVALWWATRETLRHAQADSERQSRETREQIELARQQFIATHRPKIVLRNIWLEKLVPDEPPDIAVTVVNAGSSDATITIVFSEIGTRGWQNVSWDSEITLWPVTASARHKLVSGDALRFEVKNTNYAKKLTAQQIADIEGLKSRLFVIGQVHYADGNGATRITGFIRWYDAQFRRFSEVPAEWVGSEMEYAD